MGLGAFARTVCGIHSTKVSGARISKQYAHTHTHTHTHTHKRTHLHNLISSHDDEPSPILSARMRNRFLNPTTLIPKRYGAQVDKILAWPLGGLGNTGLCKDAGDDIYVALAGPASHAPFVVLFTIIVYEQKSVHNLVLSTHKIGEGFALYLALGECSLSFKTACLFSAHISAKTSFLRDT